MLRYTIQNELINDTDNNIIIYDPTTVKWSDFDFPNGYYKHEISTIDSLKPYNISYLYYGTVIYEDIILLINKIDDPFKIRPNTTIFIPRLPDLKEFLLKKKKEI